jgi:2-oxoglutarate ferredoxin oxidoreductase subunit delta
MPPKINKTKCTGCGACVEICPVKILALKNKKAEDIKPKECIECRACENACPVNAISFK